MLYNSLMDNLIGMATAIDYHQGTVHIIFGSQYFVDFNPSPLLSPFGSPPHTRQFTQEYSISLTPPTLFADVISAQSYDKMLVII